MPVNISNRSSRKSLLSTVKTLVRKSTVDLEPKCLKIEEKSVYLWSFLLKRRFNIWFKLEVHHLFCDLAYLVRSCWHILSEYNLLAEKNIPVACQWGVDIRGKWLMSHQLPVLSWPASSFSQELSQNLQIHLLLLLLFLFSVILAPLANFTSFHWFT